MTERKTEIIDEEIEDNDVVNDKNDFLYPHENGEDDLDDEPQEREYCD